MAGRDGPYDGDEGDRDGDEGEYLGHRSEAQSGDDGGDGAHREHAELRHRRHHERDSERSRAYEPPHPCVDVVHMVMVGPRVPPPTGRDVAGRASYPCFRGYFTESGQSQDSGRP